MTGTELRVARKAAHLTQAELAQRIGRGLRTIKSWEGSGDAPIPRVATPAIEAVLRGRSVVMPPERLSDHLDAAAEAAQVNGSDGLARQLRRLALNHRTMAGDDDPVNPPVSVALGA